MRIEILVGTEDPIIFPLKSAKVVIGSGDACDITLDASGISRKHITVITEGDQFYVIDQGSTNGSFINEERLVPGKRIEFTSFFPVRLGDNVLLSLLSDEENTDFSIPVPKERTSPQIQVPREREDSTTVIKLSDLNKVKTEKLVLQRNQKRETKKKGTPAAPVKAKKKSIGIVPLTCILLVVAAGAYNFFVQKLRVDDNEPVAEIGKVIKVEKIETPKHEIEIDAVPEADIPKKESFITLLNDIKCTTDIEKYLCNTIPGANQGLWGVGQVGLDLKAVIDGSHAINQAKNFIKAPKEQTEESMATYERIVRKTAVMLFLMNELPLLDENLVKDNTISIAFFTMSENAPKLEMVVSFYPKVFNREKPNMKNNDILNVRSMGESGFSIFNKHFTVY